VSSGRSWATAAAADMRDDAVVVCLQVVLTMRLFHPNLTLDGLEIAILLVVLVPSFP
jgi:hypothetical protein